LGENRLDLVRDEDVFYEARYQARLAGAFVTAKAYAHFEHVSLVPSTLVPWLVDCFTCGHCPIKAVEKGMKRNGLAREADQGYLRKVMTSNEYLRN